MVSVARNVVITSSASTGTSRTEHVPVVYDSQYGARRKPRSGIDGISRSRRRSHVNAGSYRYGRVEREYLIPSGRYRARLYVEVRRVRRNDVRKEECRRVRRTIGRRSLVRSAARPNPSGSESVNRESGRGSLGTKVRGRRRRESSPVRTSTNAVYGHAALASVPSVSA